MAYGDAQFRSGKNSRISVNGDILAHSDWNQNYNGDRLDTRNFESQGWNEGLIGFRVTEWGTKGLWNAVDNMYDDPPGLYPRDDGTNMVCTPSTSEVIIWTLTDWLCDRSNMSTSATGLVQVDASGTSQGQPTPPSGSIG